MLLSRRIAFFSFLGWKIKRPPEASAVSSQQFSLRQINHKKYSIVQSILSGLLNLERNFGACHTIRFYGTPPSLPPYGGTFFREQGSIVLLGNFSYVAEPLKLGDLSGNRFGIVLRNLTLPSGGENGAENGAGGGQDASADKASKKEAEDAEAAVIEAGAKLKETVDRRCAWVKERGFINYFGLQRFGSGGAPTSEVGLAMLKEDWAGAVRLIMTPRMGENEATHASKVGFPCACLFVRCAWTTAIMYRLCSSRPVGLRL